MIPSEIASTIVSPWAYSDGKQVDDAFAWLRREMPLEQAQPEGYDPTFWRSSGRTTCSITATARRC